MSCPYRSDAPYEVNKAIHSHSMYDCVEVGERYPEWVGYMQMMAAYDCYITVLKQLIDKYGLDQKTKRYISMTTPAPRAAAGIVRPPGYKYGDYVK